MIRFRLKTGLWVDALRRRAEQSGAYVMIMQKGDPDAGSVCIIVEDTARELSLYTAHTQMDGTRAWAVKKGLNPREVKDKLSSLLRMDEDMWVVEIEDREGRHFIEEPILDP